MRDPFAAMSLRFLSFFLLLLIVVGTGAWLWRDSPLLQRALPASWRQALSSTPLPALPALQPAVGAAAAALRKCRGEGGITYTNGACPPGTRAEDVASGTLSVLPAAPPAALPPAAAASAQSPLRRLAGPDESAVQRERVLEQALAR
ncbi:MAG: hypothetical protein ABS84_03020 [Rubrivivax sp. SCN 71-131]|nr:MAG: hypothetical protein ABS84_03020 [Rubrivivax sp. SCN 71-131]